jgi:hypothetical protein
VQVPWLGAYTVSACIEPTLVAAVHQELGIQGDEWPDNARLLQCRDNAVPSAKVGEVSVRGPQIAKLLLS